MKKIYTFILFVVGYSSLSIAQQTPLYNQHYIDQSLYNPSYVGFKGTSVTALRNQKWFDYDGGFITNYFSAGTLLKNKKSGIGIDFYSDYVGLSSKVKAHLTYSHKVKLSEKMALRAGVSAGVIDNRINFSSAIVTDSNDPLLNGNSVVNGKTSFDVNFGLNFTFSNYYLGISVPQIVGNKLYHNSSESLYYTLERQFIINTGYKYYLSEKNKISIITDLLAIYSPNLPLNYNGSLILEWERYGWIGATYKSDYAIGLNVGINLIKNLKIGLAYDLQINEIAVHNKAPNFEILLNYSILRSVKNDTLELNSNDNIVIKEVFDMDSINDLNAEIRKLKDSINNNLQLVVENSTEPKQESDSDTTTNSTESKSELNSDTTTNSIEPKQEPDSDTTTNSTEPKSELNSDTTTNSTEQKSELNSDTTTNSTEPKSELNSDTTTNSTEPKSEPNSDRTINSTESKQEPDSDTSKDSTEPNSIKPTKNIIIKDGVSVKTNVDDYFLEVYDKSDSPNGFYVVVGAFGEKKRAEKLLRISIPEFNDARLVYNKRNNLYYVILYNSKNFSNVKTAYLRSRQLEGGRFYKAWILDYYRIKKDK